MQYAVCMYILSGHRQIETHTAEPLVHGAGHLEFEIAIAKLKKYKFPGSGITLVSVIHKLYLEYGRIV
jgi:hypothetical protein